MYTLTRKKKPDPTRGVSTNPESRTPSHESNATNKLFRVQDTVCRIRKTDLPRRCWWSSTTIQFIPYPVSRIFTV